MFDPAECLKKHEQLAAERTREEAVWKRLAELFRPDEADGFYGTERSVPNPDLFDSTTLQAVESFAGGIFGQLTNQANRWFEWEHPDRQFNSWQPVRDWCHTVTDILMASLTPAVSRFYASAPGWFGSMGWAGAGVLYQQEDIGRQRIIDRTIPMSQCYFGLDANGEINRIHRAFTLKGEQAQGIYETLPAQQADRPLKFVHCVWRNDEHWSGRGGNSWPWWSCTVSPDVKGWSLPRGYFENPYHVLMWSERPGRAYPWGPGHFALAEAGMLQEIERSHLVAAQFAAEPPLLAHSDSDIIDTDIRPNALLYGGMSDQGKELVKPMSLARDVRFSQEQAERARKAIQNAFYFGIMQMVQRPQMTATEVRFLNEESLRLMAPNLARIQNQGLTPFLERRFAILDRAGQIPPPPPELQGQRIEATYTSPLARLAKLNEADATLRWIGAIGQLAQVKPEVLDTVDEDGVADLLHEAYGVPPAARRPRDQVDQIRAGRAQVQGQQLELDQAQQATDIEAERSHAEQAATLARSRAARP